MADAELIAEQAQYLRDADKKIAELKAALDKVTERAAEQAKYLDAISKVLEARVNALMVKTIRVWMPYRPFIMGGNVNVPVCADVEIHGYVDMKLPHTHPRVTLVHVKDMQGRDYYVESASGALMGTDLNSLYQDYRTAAPEILSKQLDEAVERAKGATEVDPEEFWECAPKPGVM